MKASFQTVLIPHIVVLSMIVLLGELTSGDWIKTPYHILHLPVIDMKKMHQPLALSRLVPLHLADDLSQ